jgi:hypothetical protein
MCTSATFSRGTPALGATPSQGSTRASPLPVAPRPRAVASSEGERRASQSAVARVQGCRRRRSNITSPRCT